MHNKLIRHWNELTIAFKLLILTLLALGVFFRFSGLNDRAYWHDEIYTLLRSSGHTIIEVTTQAFTGQPLDRADLLRFQHLSPEKTSLDLLRSLVTEEPHRAPLYYGIARLWMRQGDSVAVLRSLSALISLLAFPALYWLCLELFGSALIGWIAVALLSVSPFFVHYAQEIREYSLWTVITLAMCIAFLRATRINTKSTWFSYTFTIALSLYTTILSIPVIVSYGFYFLVNRDLACKVNTFLKFTLLGFLIYLPWLSFTFINLSQVQRISAWMFEPTSITVLVTRWLTNVQFLFVKEDLTRAKILFVIAIALLIYLAARSVLRTAPRNAWVLIAVLILPLFLSLAIPDLVLGGLRSTNDRYFVPGYLGLELAVAYWLATQINSTRSWMQHQGKLVLITLLTVGILSCTVQLAQSRTSDDQLMAQMINRNESAIVVSNEISRAGGGTIGDVLVLSHLVKPGTQFQLVIQPTVPSLPTGVKVYLYKPLSYLKEKLQQRYQVQPVYRDKLFQLTSR